jgi:hypothetical protein
MGMQSKLFISMSFYANNNMKDYLKVEGSLTNDNYELIEEAKYFEDLDVHGDYYCTGIQLSHFSFSFIFSKK